MLFLGFFSDIFAKLDGFVEKIIKPVFDGFTSFWADICSRGGRGAYFCFILVGIFFVVVFLIGLFNFMKKFGWFLVFLILTVGVPLLWYFFCTMN